MKTWKIFWGLGFILAAVLIILDAIDVQIPFTQIFGDVSLIAAILGLFLLIYTLARLIKGKLTDIFFPLAFIFMLFEKNIAHLAGREDENIINNWLVLLIALLLTIGVSILFPKRNGCLKVNHDFRGDTKIHHSTSENALGSSTIYVDASTMTPSLVENNLGSCQIHFQNVDNYKGDGVLNIETNLGSMVIHVPSSWTVKSSVDCNLGAFNCPKNINTDGPLLFIKGEANLGAITVKFI